MFYVHKRNKLFSVSAYRSYHVLILIQYKIASVNITGWIRTLVGPELILILVAAFFMVTALLEHTWRTYLGVIEQ